MLSIDLTAVIDKIGEQGVLYQSRPEAKPSQITAADIRNESELKHLRHGDVILSFYYDLT